ncbi:SNF2 domain-containing protein CLASSY 4 [Raphanus sativus]|uniref:SNF2 domain-containing protein CLASSY 4 n=1 Tax=Raphanus sativus TaxID=3726 RepID=A0A6J0PA24_RAPSA|nr:SNF2 domain-containing protein CLASSY 4 [Raphanus sativus]KAJ4894478.1 SNF2 domain-containing protein CLASSY 4 [Raphanus sativus]
MDMTTCVGRRTRSKTESYLNSLLNRSKGIDVENQSRSRIERRKKRDSLRDAAVSPPKPKPKRRREKKRKDDDVDDVEFVETIYPKGKEEDDDNVGSPSVIAPSLKSKLPDRDRNCAYTVNSIDEEEEKKVTETDEVVSLSCGSEEDSGTEVCGEDDYSDEEEEEDVESDSSDYIKESSDSTYTGSSDSGFDCSDDDDEVGGDARNTAKVKNKSPSERVYKREKRKSYYKKNDLDVFKLLAKSVWERTKIFDEDICSGDDEEETAAEVDTREDPIARENSGEYPVVRERKRRRYHREKKKKHLNVTDQVGDSVCEDGGESFGVGGKPWVSTHVNLRFGCEEEHEPIEKTEEEKEIDRLWEDMALALSLEGVHSSTHYKCGDVSCSNGKHDFVLDEEVGLKCRYCSYVSVEIRDVSPTMDKYRANINDKKTCSDKKGSTLLDSLDFEASDRSRDMESSKNTQGTVWEYIPGIKNTMYPHQQEGFEFMWKNLAGTTKLDELKSSVGKESGGCIISHSPGTGKTRLTIVFLQSFLEQFPESHPVVIAPASLMLTWEEEFKKWNSNIPFYNMSSQDFSGQENQSAVSLLKGNRHLRRNKDAVRMVKLYSWTNKKSILGISYNLYEKLAGNRCAGEVQEFRKMLLELPGLLVLDEGHTPRNHNSCIWKVLTEVKTLKRIILSGTPFQNNFKELSNVLCLTRPAYADKISSRLQDLTRLSQEGKNGRFDEEVGISELKDMIAPFVHVHKGNILRESLPGLRDCVVMLNPPFQQEKILKRIDHSQNTFELEHKLSAVSVHPSLYMCCKQTDKERLTIGPVALKVLESLRLDSKEGAKTRFLIDFIRFSQTVNEKVLVFSQYIDTLELIRDQLNAVFGWKEGEEILYMHGQLKQTIRQHLINNFNRPDSKSKVLLASTGACSEGIHLVGASRVVLLDVVWNPSVERQAISRAYRIGQKRVVYTYHLMVKGTTEWGKYCKQTKKHRISEMVFSPTNEKDKLIENDVVSEDKILDEMVRHEKLKDMFGKVLYRKKESDMFTDIL